MIFIQAILAGLLYRLGGWIQTKFRDWGCPAVVMWVLWEQYPWYLLLAVFGLLWWALSSYYDWLCKEDNFFLHGLGCGLAFLPLCFAGVHWYSVLIYALVLAVIMGALNVLINKTHVPFSDWIEEFTRGAILILALKILSV